MPLCIISNLSLKRCNARVLTLCGRQDGKPDILRGYRSGVPSLCLKSCHFRTEPAASLIMTLFQLRQSILLLITATIWGATFIAQSLGMDNVDPFTFTAGRMFFGVAFLLPIVLVLRARLKQYHSAEATRRSAPEYKRNLLIGSLLCGLCLFGGESLQQFGLFNDAEVGKAGFITSLYIVIVPLLGLFVGKRLTPTLIIAVILSVFGLWYLCVPPGGFHVELGDSLIAMCALVFSFHIMVISHFVQKVNGIELAVGQFSVGGLLGFISMLIFGAPTWAGFVAALPAILWAGVMSNGIAYTLQIVGQRGMNDTIASLIMSLESVVAVICGWLILDEALSSRELFGCLLMGGAVVLAQIPFSSIAGLFKRKRA